MDQDHLEDLESFTNVLRSRYYNSGYREGLFKGKGEVIQDGFDKGFLLGSTLEVLKVLEGAFQSDKINESNESNDNLCEAELIKEIVEIRGILEEIIPEIKIASNLYKV